jgi:hypothetical protein
MESKYSAVYILVAVTLLLSGCTNTTVKNPVEWLGSDQDSYDFSMQYFERNVDEVDGTITHTLKSQFDQISLHAHTEKEPFSFGLIPSIEGVGPQAKLSIASWWVGNDPAFHARWSISDPESTYNHTVNPADRVDNYKDGLADELSFSVLTSEETEEFCSVLSPGYFPENWKFRFEPSPRSGKGPYVGTIPALQGQVLWASCLLFSAKFELVGEREG